MRWGNRLVFAQIDNVIEIANSFISDVGNKVATGPGWLYLIAQGLLLSVCVICVCGGFNGVVDNPVAHFIE